MASRITYDNDSRVFANVSRTVGFPQGMNDPDDVLLVQAMFAIIYAEGSNGTNPLNHAFRVPPKKLGIGEDTRILINDYQRNVMWRAKPDGIVSHAKPGGNVNVAI